MPPPSQQSKNPNAYAVQRLFQKKTNTTNAAAAAMVSKGGKPSWTTNFGSSAPDDGGKENHTGGASLQRGMNLFGARDVPLASTADFVKHLGGQDNGSASSCFLLGCQKRMHAVTLGDGAKAPIQNQPMTQLEHAMQYRKNLYIERNERGMQRRRVVDPYIELTGAQQGLRSVVPTAAFADRQVHEKHKSWVLHNQQRQHMVEGEPLMTRVMRGEYYIPKAVPKGPRKDHVTSNKMQVRCASAASRLLPEPGHVHCHTEKPVALGASSSSCLHGTNKSGGTKRGTDRHPNPRWHKNLVAYS